MTAPRSYKLIHVKISGETPLMMQRFPDGLDPLATKSALTSGETSTPREQAEAFVYQHEGRPYFPGSNIFAALIDAGRFHKSGRQKLTTRDSSLLPGSMSVLTEHCWVEPPEWEVDTRPVVNPTTKGRVLRHRPRFDKWALEFTLRIDSAELSESLARSLVDDAGRKLGIGSMRPSRKGSFGVFKVVTWEIEDSD